MIARTNRRNFLKSSSILAGGLLAARSARALGSNDRIAVGVVGVGVRGTYHIQALGGIARQKLADVEVVAIAELWAPWRDRAVAKAVKAGGRQPQAFARHTDLLEKGGVDAVVITTPDFWHVPVLLDAVRAGKDVYVEKPLCVKFEEARAARDAVRASKQVVQVGTQRRTENRFKAAREFVRSGKLGKISGVEGGFNDHGPRWRREAECKTMRESDLDWKWYLGRLPDRPFNPRHVLEWKLFRDFTMGCSGLLGCHLYDSLQFVLDAPFPAGALSQGGVYVYKDGREVEDTFETLIDFPEEFVMHYRTRLGNSTPGPMTLFGTHGTLNIDTGTYTGAGGRPGKDRLPPGEHKLEIPPDAPHAHMVNFLECMRSRKEPNASIEAGYRHAVTSILAQEAMYAGRRLRYDAKSEQII